MDKLELAQINDTSASTLKHWWAIENSNLRPLRCQGNASLWIARFSSLPAFAFARVFGLFTPIYAHILEPVQVNVFPISGECS